MTLTESQDDAVRAAAPRQTIGRKWTPSGAVQQAQSALRHGDIGGHVQQGRGGIGLRTSRPTWHKATSTQRRKLEVAEVRQQEEAKAVSQSKHGQWTTWENLERCKLTWKDLWEMEGSRLSFIIRATYDVLVTPKNLNQWLGEDPSCSLCQTPATLRHIQSFTRPLHLEAQSGPATTGDYRGRENYHQCPPSLNAWFLQHHPSCKGRTTPREAICKKGPKPSWTLPETGKCRLI